MSDNVRLIGDLMSEEDAQNSAREVLARLTPIHTRLEQTYALLYFQRVREEFLLKAEGIKRMPSETYEEAKAINAEIKRAFGSADKDSEEKKAYDAFFACDMRKGWIETYLALVEKDPYPHANFTKLEHYVNLAEEYLATLEGFEATRLEK